MLVYVTLHSNVILVCVCTLLIFSVCLGLFCVTFTPRKELSVLLELLLIQRYISEWRFLPAIVTIQSCETTLLGWHGMVPLETSVSHMNVT